MSNSGVVSFVPATFEELYREYLPYVQTLVRKFGIDQGNVEDVTSQLMIKLLEKDLVSQYNGQLVSTHTGKPVEFKSYLYGFVSAYIQHHRTRQQVIKRRDCYYIGQSDEDTPWMAEHGLYHQDSDEDLAYAEMLGSVREVLDREPRRANDPLPLRDFFEQALTLIEETGRFSQTEMERIFQVSHTTIWVRTQRLRVILRAVADR